MSVELAAPASPYEHFCSTLRSRGPTLNLLFEQARVSPEREGDTIVRDAFAAALVTVLHGMLRELWASLGGTKTSWKGAGPLVNGLSIGQILAAAVDNSRRFEEWDREKVPELLAHRSVRVLCVILAISVKKAPKHPPFRGSVCWAILEALGGGGDYRAIEALVREYAANLQISRAT